MTDHEPLCPMYNSPSRPLPVRVAKHKSKLRGFSFKVTYEPGSTNPSDYGSRHPPPSRKYMCQEKDELGVEEEREDMEIIVNRIVKEAIPDAFTLPVVRYYTKLNGTLNQLGYDLGLAIKT